jgi:predicted DNA-binding protein YlxM (UPF0122 family)
MKLDKIIDSRLSQEALQLQKEYRRRFDTLKTRAKLLKGKNKILMTMYLERGNSFREVARLIGVNETTIARRIHKLIQQLLDDRYFLCIRNRERFDPLELTIAKDYFLMGLPMSKIARQRKLSYYQLRKTIAKINCFIAAIKHPYPQPYIERSDVAKWTNNSSSNEQKNAHL